MGDVEDVVVVDVVDVVGVEVNSLESWKILHDIFRLTKWIIAILVRKEIPEIREKTR